MNTINLTIAPIFNDDCKPAIDLILPIQQIEFNVPVTIEDQPDLLDIEANYHQAGGNFWGAKINNELVGTIALLNTGHNAGALRKMFVKKEFRGKEYGIAQQLLETLITYCREKNINDIYLGTVDMLKAAHRFYEKNSFNHIEATDLPSYFPRMMADNKFYHLHLNV
ncbi:GNAT family N-acetyltransferase [Pedobacter metabolipauper]|uniref:N-acetylglutamate synthase-like GNAT family acetyltransferase n=1 Tax=Pedobacter metabolipauper TaxID=425513 RepID=A0A4R6T0X1_9SPHI|nr:GNAT family N-acetyltransferase [Pedobacter metabolipauper]TDQ11699.1 N-acetylglutamate synthase-like GNAT family acetyltransferase [Pedobacter metabolipauper]